MSWVWIAATVWVVVAITIALLIARAIGLADRKATEEFEEAPNFVVDRSPLHVEPPPGAPDDPKPAPRPTPPPSTRGASTIPGLPSARPPVGRPPVPPPAHHRRRESGLG